MKIINTLKEFIKDIIKDIRYFFDTEKLDIDDIPPMRYPEGTRQENFVNPFAKYNSRNSRIRYKR